MTQNRQAYEMEHQLSIALVDSDGWKQMEFGIAVHDTVCPQCSLTVIQAFVCLDLYSDTDQRGKSATSFQPVL